MSTSTTDWPADSPVRKRRLYLRELAPWLVAAVLSVVLGVVLVWVAHAVAGRVPVPPRGEPVVSRSFYAERNGADATGRVCSQTVVTVPGDVAVAVSCSYPPAESRIADLLEGAGQ
jgi:hypothetical protein